MGMVAQRVIATILMPLMSHPGIVRHHIHTMIAASESRVTARFITFRSDVIGLVCMRDECWTIPVCK
jgi:hypothetical protein